jgi:predicted phage terminase large subunit-like protein
LWANDLQLDAELLTGLTKGFLAARYDNPKPIPKFHAEMWGLACREDEPRVAIAAPRGHAKSTAMTHAYVLAMMLFRIRDFCLVVSDTEGQAVEFLGDIKAELQGNEALRSAFGVKKLLKDTEANVVCMFQDGHIFRIQAKGSEQKVRGLKWRNRRPNLIVGDDLENDEIVMNPERREKFRKWFMNALIPAGSDDCLVRIVGTILHLDSMLQRLLDDPTWTSLRYEAEDGNFENILWPEQFPPERLRRIRDSYAAQGDIEGYFQEYLNRPIGDENLFFRKADFIDEDRDKHGNKILPNLVYFAAADFAISESQKADYTVIMIGGMDPQGILHIVDVRSGRWDAEEIIEELLSVQKRYKPIIFTFETMTIDKAIGPFLDREMLRRGIFININKVTPTKSKTARGKSIQAMMKAGAVRFDKEADWYPATESELLTIATSGPRGAHDDRFDAFSYIGLTVDQYYEAQTPEEEAEEEYEAEMESMFSFGANEDTGY